jgi:hypothetical protein
MLAQAAQVACFLHPHARVVASFFPIASYVGVIGSGSFHEASINVSAPQC